MVDVLPVPGSPVIIIFGMVLVSKILSIFCLINGSKIISLDCFGLYFSTHGILILIANDFVLHLLSNNNVLFIN